MPNVLFPAFAFASKLFFISFPWLLLTYFCGGPGNDGAWGFPVAELFVCFIVISISGTAWL